MKRDILLKSDIFVEKVELRDTNIEYEGMFDKEQKYKNKKNGIIREIHKIG